MSHYVERKWVLIDPITAVITLETRVSLDADLTVGHGPCVLMLKTLPRGPRIEEQHGHHVWHRTRASRRICLGATSAFELKHDLHVDMRP